MMVSEDPPTRDRRRCGGRGAGPARARVVIVGTGFSGLGMAIGLKRAGIDDFVVLERAGDLGGTWRDNTYPGCACDVQSDLYSFSFAPNPDWRHRFSSWSAIQAYLRHCAARFGITPHIRWGHEVRDAQWDDDAGCWRVATGRGAFVAEVLVLATGPLSEPAAPAIPGLDSFAGTVFHSARWAHDHDLGGERVAVIGTGASAIQFVPQIQPRVGRLLLFQRTPPWVVPRLDRPVSRRRRALYRALPLAQLQAHPPLRRLLSRADAAERGGGHRAHPRDTAARDRHRGRAGAGGRHAHPRHRLPRRQRARRQRGPGARRPFAR
jgi:cation diffusion facilitator CzcD-associated flavoprotein CzcO